jgi:uncharacterized phiE125 gp8 family phage protein
MADVREFMGIVRVADTSRFAQIEQQITAARMAAESFTETAIMPQSWSLYAPKFQQKINLRPQLQSIESVKYYDDSGALSTVDPSVYIVDMGANCIELMPGQAWPSPQIRTSAVVIEYSCGYAAISDIPAPILQAIKFLVAHWENNQKSIEGAMIKTIPYAVEQMLSPYKDWRNYFA